MIGQIDEEFYWEVYNYKKFNTNQRKIIIKIVSKGEKWECGGCEGKCEGCDEGNVGGVVRGNVGVW